MKSCPKCGKAFSPRRRGQRFCTRNCGRWKHHDAIEKRLSARPPGCPDEAYLAGLIASDGYIERRVGRSEPTGLAIKMAAPAEPLLRTIGERFGRAVYSRSNGQFVVTFIDLPVRWKLELPELMTCLETHYVRGLIDGDGCWSGARAAGRFYPYVSLAFNPTKQNWIGDYYVDWLERHRIGYRIGIDRPTVHQVRSWSAEAREVARLLYPGGRNSPPVEEGGSVGDPAIGALAELVNFARSTPN